MVSYVEANPGDAAKAASRLLNTSNEMLSGQTPPDPDSVGWGDDEFGEWMRSEYLKNVDDGPCLPDRCAEETNNIGGRCGELGDGIHKAMHGFELQEMVNTHQMETSFDETEDSGTGGGSGGGGPTGGGSGGGTAPATTTPPSNPAPTSQESSGESSTRGVSITSSMFRTLQMPDDQEESADEPSNEMMMVGRMFRALQRPDEQEPSSEEEDSGEEPERRAFMTRLLRFPDHSDGLDPEEPAEPSPETEPDPDTEPHRIHRVAQWHLDPTTTESAPDAGPDTGTDNGRIYRSRWMFDPTAADAQPHQTNESPAQE